MGFCPQVLVHSDLIVTEDSREGERKQSSVW